MSEYSKKKNDELAALCKERGLPHTGKKADLVKRLEESDAGSATGAQATKTAIEDEIDWDDEPATETAKAATSEAAANAVAAGGIGEVSNPQAVPNQVAAIDPAQTDDLTIGEAPATNGAASKSAEEKPVVEEKDFSTGLEDRTLEQELEKRKARARKFGLPEDSDEIKALERAVRFGTKEVPGLLNKALPSERKRGRDAAEHDGGIRKRSKARSGLSGQRKPSEKKEQGSMGQPSWMSQTDIEKMERRKAKFAQT